MPERADRIEETGPPETPFCVVSEEGERIACHATREEAIEQLAAIEAAKASREDGPEIVQRFDFGTLGKAVEVPGGGIRVPAYSARTGVQVYRDADGQERREYRDASEVFSPESLATYADAPVTVGHPPGMLTIATRRQYERGHVREGKRADATGAGPYRTPQPPPKPEWVEAGVVVTDAETVRRVLARELTEVSMGYEAEVVPSTRADADFEQRNIRINHLALLPPGHARAGRGASLRLDSGAEMVIDSAGPARPTIGADTPEGTQDMTVKIKIDGVGEVEEGGAEHIAYLSNRADSLATERDTVQAKYDAEVDAHKATKEALEAAQAKLDAVETRALAERLKPLTGDLKLDGLSRREMLAAAVKAKVPGFDPEGRSDDYLAARVDAILEAEPAPAPSAPQAPRIDSMPSNGFALAFDPQGQAHAIGPNGRQLSALELARLDSEIAARSAAETYRSPLVKGSN